MSVSQILTTERDEHSIKDNCAEAIWRDCDWEQVEDWGSQKYEDCLPNEYW